MRFVNNFQIDECSIPEGMTLDEWRRSRTRPRRSRRARVRVLSLSRRKVGRADAGAGTER